APIGLSRHKRDLGIQVEGKIMPRPAEKPNPALGPIRERILNEKYREEEARNFDNVAQVRAMDKEGLDIAILYPSRGLFDLAEIGLSRHKRDLGIQVEGKIMPRPAEKPNPALGPIRERILNEKYREEEARNFDNVAQVRAMDKEGLDIAILYPSRGLFVLA